MTDEQKTCCYLHPTKEHQRSSSCQFMIEPGIAGNLVELNGKTYCPYHLPFEGGKSSWDYSQAHTFNRNLSRRLTKDGDIDLRGVVFAKDFKSQKEIAGETRFDNCQFHGVADFSSTSFAKEADFSKASFFGQAKFDGVQFNGRTNFFGVKFHSGFVFNKAIFADDVNFSHAVFTEKQRASDGQFQNVNFKKKAHFDHTTCHASMNFNYSVFSSQTDFFNAEFWEGAWFFMATFESITHFDHARFIGPASFSRSKFEATARFSSTQFLEDARFNTAYFRTTAEFDRAHFSGRALFENLLFGRESDASSQTFCVVNFASATFKSELNFSDRNFTGKTSFQNAIFSYAPFFHGCSLHQDTTFPPIDNFADTESTGSAHAYRTLRLAMKQQEAHEEEAMFWALEQRSKRNNLDLMKPKNWFPWGLSWAYDIFSNYGLNAGLPARWLGGWVVYSTVIYACVAGSWEKITSVDLWLGALGFSIAQMARPFFIWGDYDGADIKAALGSNEFSFLIKMLATVDSIVSLTLVALFILAVRRRFRMQ